MKRIFFILSSILSFAFLAIGQTTKFAVIQTTDNKPFFVKMPNVAKPLSSTTTGYIILPKIVGNQNINIGFLGNNETYSFNIDASNGDKGFLLKNTDDKGWALFNWQSLDYVYQTNVNNANVATAVKPQVTNEGNPLNDMLVKVTGDNEINIKEDKPTSKTTVVTVNKESPTNVEPLKVTDKPNVAVADATKTEPIKKEVIEPTKTENTAKENIVGVINLMENSDENGYTGNFKVTNDDKTTDVVTVNISPKILINEDAELLKKEANAKLFDSLKIAANSKAYNDSLKNVVKVEPPIDKQNVVIEKPLELKVSEALLAKPKVDANVNANLDANAEKLKVVLPMVNTDCAAKDIATDVDVEDLFAKMAIEKDTDEKMLLAKRTFKKKCFTALQIKNLAGALFSDRNKYELLYTAYPYVSDTDNFKKLENLLTEPAYINMFKAMVNK